MVQPYRMQLIFHCIKHNRKNLYQSLQIDSVVYLNYKNVVQKVKQLMYLLLRNT